MVPLPSYVYHPTCTCREVRQAGWGACIVWKVCYGIFVMENDISL